VRVVFGQKPSHFAYYLEDGEKKLIPYQDGQSITFLRDDGQEFGFKVKRNYSRVDNANLAPAEWCGTSTLSYDIDKITFEPAPSDPTFAFPEITLMPGNVDKLGYIKGIRFSNGGLLSFGNFYDVERALSEAELGTFFVLDYDQNYNLKESITSFKDTIRYVGSAAINGINYDDIYELKQNPSNLLNYQGNDYEALSDIIIWYNQKNGILKFSYQYSKLFKPSTKKFELTLKP